MVHWSHLIAEWAAGASLFQTWWLCCPGRRRDCFRRLIIICSLQAPQIRRHVIWHRQLSSNSSLRLDRAHEENLRAQDRRNWEVLASANRTVRFRSSYSANCANTSSGASYWTAAALWASAALPSTAARWPALRSTPGNQNLPHLRASRPSLLQLSQTSERHDWQGCGIRHLTFPSWRRDGKLAGSRWRHRISHAKLCGKHATRLLESSKPSRAVGHSSRLHQCFSTFLLLAPRRPEGSLLSAKNKAHWRRCIGRNVGARRTWFS